MKNRNTSPCWAAFASILLLAAIACQSPNSPSSISKTGTSSLSVSIVNPSGRTVAAGSADIGIATLAISVTGGASSVAPVTGINYGTFTAQTFSLLTAGTYTVSVNAYNTSSVLVASGSSSVTVNAGSTTSATVALTLGQTGGSGAFSLAIAWPTSTGLNSVSATVDGIPLIYTPTVSTSGANYTSTLAQGVLTSGVHTLAITFKTSVGAAVGPFLESLNIWDGVTSTTWVDSSGNNQSQRTFSAAEFASNNTDLSGLTISGGALTGTFSSATTSYTLSTLTGTSLTVTASPSLSSQNVSLSWNGAAQAWSSVTSSSLGSSALSLVDGVNTVQITITAPDRQTTKTYTITTPTITSSSNFVTAIASNLSGSYYLTQDVTVSAPLGGGSAFTGTLDGNGHTVTLSVTGSSNNAGLFGQIGGSGIVKNLTISGSLSGGNEVGALAGSNAGTVSNVTTSATISGSGTVGGIVGNNTGTLTDCSSTGAISSVGNNLGGIAGSSSGNLYHCYSAGTITGTASSETGGLVGTLSGSVSECYSVAVVNSGSGLGAGGLVGLQGGSVLNSYARGAVTAPAYVGVVTGDNRGLLQDTYATGLTTGGLNGGLRYSYNPETVTDSYCFLPSDNFYLPALNNGVPTAWSPSIWGWSASINQGFPYLLYFGSGTLIP